MKTIKESLPVTIVQTAFKPTNWPDRITRVTTSDSRYYEVLGQKLPSVTSVLQVMPKPALVEWRIKKALSGMHDYLSSHSGKPITPELLKEASTKGQTGSIKESQDAAAIGSAVHELISMDLLGKEIDEDEIDEDLRCAYASYLLWKKEKGSELMFIESETAVYFPSSTMELGYAGTIDALFRKDDGNTVLVDFKTSKRIWRDHLVQLWAYVHALENAVDLSRESWKEYPTSFFPLAAQNGIAAQVVRLQKHGSPRYEIHDLVKHYGKRTETLNVSMQALWDIVLSLHSAINDSGNETVGD